MFSTIQQQAIKEEKERSKSESLNKNLIMLFKKINKTFQKFKNNQQRIDVQYQEKLKKPNSKRIQIDNQSYSSSKFKVLKSTTNTQNSRVEQYQFKIEELKDQNAEQQYEIKTLKKVVKDKNKKINDLERKVQELQRKLSEQYKIKIDVGGGQEIQNYSENQGEDEVLYSNKYEEDEEEEGDPEQKVNYSDEEDEESKKTIDLIQIDNIKI